LLYDPVANGQSDSTSWIFFTAMQPFEEPENVFSVLSFNADSVVSQAK